MRSFADFRFGSRAAVAGRLMARPVYPKLRKYPVRFVTYAACQHLSSKELPWPGRRSNAGLECHRLPSEADLIYMSMQHRSTTCRSMCRWIDRSLSRVSWG